MSRKHLPRQMFDNQYKYSRRLWLKRDRKQYRLHDKIVDLMTTHGVFSSKWRRVARRYYRVVLKEQMIKPIWDVVAVTRRRSRI